MVSYSTDYQCHTAPRLLRISTASKPETFSQRLSFSKTVSLRALNSIAKSIKSKFTPEKTTPTKQYSKSVECILTTNSLSSPQHTPFDYPFSNEEQENMTTLRRVESERKVAGATARLVHSACLHLEFYDIMQKDNQQAVKWVRMQ